MTAYGPPAPTALDRLRAAWSNLGRFINTTLPALTSSLRSAAARLAGTSQPPTGGGSLRLQ